MNKALRAPDYLGHMLVALGRIERYATHVDETTFLSSELIQDAVIRNLEVIGEAANNLLRVDPGFAQSHPQIPWEVMYAMRHRLAHGYDKVDIDMVWKTVRRDLPVLRQQITAAVDALDPGV
jgi:uncharacterized protein with HEPN domain